MKKLILGIIVLLCLFASSCTENIRAKSFGGNITIELPKNTKLIEATWKNADLWYLVRERRANETAETYRFIEDSTYGVMEGEIRFVEK